MAENVETSKNVSSNAHEGRPMKPSKDFVEYLREYAREKPDVVALWCFGVGFVLGWKLKPW